MPTWIRIAEHNSWEGETWYHYFELTDDPDDAPSANVKAVLQLVVEDRRNDLGDLTEIDLSWDTAEALANQPVGYLEPHWFGTLTDPEKLLTDVAAGDALYKGKIRKYGEEAFEYVLVGHNSDAPILEEEI